MSDEKPYILRVAGNRHGKTTDLLERTVAAIRDAMPSEVVVHGDLDEAWAVAEAELPDGWSLTLDRIGTDDYTATAGEQPTEPGRPYRTKDAATPDAALLALAKELRALR